MGDWMGSCVDVKFNLEVLVFIFYFLTHVKEGLPHYFLTMCDTWHTVDPSDLFVME